MYNSRPSALPSCLPSVAGMQQASDERVLSLLRGANQLLLTHPEARRRNLQFSTPSVISLTGARLYEDDPAAVPYSDAYDTNCLR